LDSVVDKDCCKLSSELSEAALRSPAPVVEPAEAVAAEFPDVADENGDDESDKGDADDVDDEANADCTLCPALGICCTVEFADEAS
jgi:hypothetical protein